MKIPEGVNHKEFYTAAKAQGASIQSRFTGVYLNVNGSKVTWMARCQVKGVEVFLGRFPFTSEGEVKAGLAYENYCLEKGIPIEGKRAIRSKYKKSTNL